MIILTVFGVRFSIESLQYFDIDVFGSTFDPLDYVMYAMGAILAFKTDVFFLSKLKAIEK